MRRLSEFREDRGFFGTVPLSAIANMEVTITKATALEGRYGPVIILDVETQDGKKLRVRVGAQVPMRLILKAVEENALPVTATFFKNGRYWDVR